MGGKGSGGRRPGTGPKPKTRHLHLVDGTGGNRNEPAPTEVVEPFDPPPQLELFGEELAMWEYMAPLAFKKRTLTRETALAFSILCRNIVREKRLAKSADVNGADHRGLIQRIDAELLSFDLRPNGKAIYDAGEGEHNGTPVNPLARFGFGA